MPRRAGERCAKGRCRPREIRYDRLICDFSNRGGPVELDDFDRRLLDALQQDSRRTGEQLAVLVGLSPAACLRRAQRLRETGVIEREIAIVAPEAVGRRMTMVVQVTLEREKPATSDEFQRQMRRAPEVTQCYNVTGAIDFVLIVSVADMEAYEDFTRQYLFEKHVRRFETMVVIERVKFETTVPIADGGRD
jgi:Lrp/AsnC family transcriptional regulator, leucine-responsive regulatory protein